MIAQRGKNGIQSRQRFYILAKEFFRKSIHICSAFIPLLLHYAYPLTLSLLGTALVVYSICEILRVYKGISVPIISAVTAAAARKRDENRFVVGPVTLVLGIILSSLLFSEKAACIGIYALAFGDGLASLGGKLFGRVQIPFTEGKTVAGSLTCFLAIFISSFLVCHSAGTALVLAASGMFIEVLPLRDADNILIPVAIGCIAQVLL